nr:hypothetical transcript [Hymenolepis microstoma]
MVKFKGKNEVIDCQKIERIQRNNDYGVIIVVVKTKKNYSKLFAMRFLDNSEFLRFYDTINPAPTSVVVFEERGQSATSKKRKRSRTKSETNRAEPVLTTKVPSSQAPGQIVACSNAISLICLHAFNILAKDYAVLSFLLSDSATKFIGSFSAKAIATLSGI